MRAPVAAFEAEREAILENANSSQLEPYDYKLSLRHQAFNAALRGRPDLNRSMGEIEWVKDISQAQYRSQLSRDPLFNPEVRLSPAPDWTKNKLNGRIFADPASLPSERPESPSGVQTLTTTGQLSRTSPVLLVTNTPNNYSDPDQAVSAHAGLSTLPPGNPAALDSLPDNPKSPELITRSILGPSAKTFPAQTCSGVYRGAIIAETQKMVLQRLSAYSVIAHPKELFGDEHVPKVGTNVCVSYSNGKPLVRELLKREKAMEVGR
jgi:hypothetical protein